MTRWWVGGQVAEGKPAGQRGGVAVVADWPARGHLARRAELPGTQGRVGVCLRVV